MKKNIEYLSFTALVLVGTLMTACSVKEEVLPEDPRPIPQDGLVMLSTTVGFEQSETRALTADGEKTFAAGDQIAVIYTNTSDNTVKAVSEVLTADKISAGGKSATFYVGVSNPKANSDVIYIYPASMAADDSGTPDLDALSVQDGKLESIARNLDYARFEGTLTAKAELPASATLENQLTICEFTLLDSIEDTDLSASITELRIQEGFNAYTVNWTPAAGPIYVAMRPVTDNSITVTVQKSSVNYQKTFTNKTLSANRIYPITVMMPLQTMQEVPLTFEALTAGTQVSFKLDNVASGPVEYRTLSDGAWTSWTSYTSNTPISLAEIGDKVQFRGTNEKYASPTNSERFSHFTCTKNCKLYGNIMSLIDANSFAQLTVLTGSNAFRRLFDNSSWDIKVLSDPDKPLLLPATTLTDSCYEAMLKSTAISTAPALPATSLVNYCYCDMFNGCASLTAAPELPATTLALECYWRMFNGCASLTAAPELPATTLAYGCYASMFAQCSSLSQVPESLPATTLAADCYNRMFCECTSLTVAPELPAPSLVDGCYGSMFKGCTNLSRVTCLATDISASYCTNIWLNNVPAAGTFIRAPKPTPWERTGDGIPSGWEQTVPVGKVVSTDGNCYASASAATAAGKTPCALIFYAGDVGETDATFRAGLAIALQDCSTTHEWGNKGTEQDQSVFPNVSSISAANADLNGIRKTLAMVNFTGTDVSGREARGFNSPAAPSYTSGWFLPTAGQWNLFLKYCGQEIDTAVWGGFQHGASGTVTVNKALTDVGGTGFNGDTYGYWTSSQNGADYAVRVVFDPSYGLAFGEQDKGAYYTHVRPFLAFTFDSQGLNDYNPNEEQIW